MSLFKQIEIFVTLLLITILITMLNINFNNTREFAENQLYTDAKNTVNTLSLSLNSMSGDLALMETAINAMFDGGYFEVISLTQNDGAKLYVKKQHIEIEGVPDFFIKFVKLQAPVAQAKILDSWNVFGTLKIKAHAGYYYLRLWNDFKEMCIWFAVVGIIALALSHFILKYILGSLFQIKDQADAIANNEFIINKNIPRTTETRIVVIAMNSMVAKVQKIYNREIDTLNKYQALRFKDSLTGLHNRHYFLQQLNTFMDSNDEKSSGKVMIISLEGIEKAGEIVEYQQRTAFYQDLANIINETTGMLPKVTASLNKSEFGIILPAYDFESSMDIAKIMNKQISNAISRQQEFKSIVTNAIGITAYSYNDSTKTILSSADYALAVAKRQFPENIYFSQDANSKILPGKQEWKNIIENALENNLFILSSQSVLLEDTELHREVFTSMLDKQKHVQKCGFFMPMVISLNFAIKLDKYVLEKAVDYLKTNKKIVLAVNITNEFMKDRSSFIWFRQFLISSKSYNKRLIFEISDNTVVQHTEICNDFVGLVKGLGYSFGVDNFILDNDSLSYLKKLKPEYIKINQDYLLDKSEDKKTDTAIKSLITVTDSLDILLIVTKIETEEQIAIFKSKNIQYFQGLAVADIVPMETDNG